MLRGVFPQGAVVHKVNCILMLHEAALSRSDLVDHKSAVCALITSARYS